MPSSLAGYALTEGVQFRFATGTVAVLAPGARVVVARNAGALLARYPQLDNLAGQYEGGLANEGERLTVTGPLGVKSRNRFAMTPDGIRSRTGWGSAWWPRRIRGY